MSVGQGFPIGGGAPYQSNGSDFAVNGKQYPGFILNPIASEVNGVYWVVREINGALWQIQNADVSASGQFFQINPLLPSYALVTQNGQQTIFTAAAGLAPFVWTATNVSLLGNTRPGGRLTLTSGVPVLTADVVNAGTVYYTPYNGNLVPVFVGPSWQNVTFIEIGLALNATFQTTGNLYDVFLYNNAGVVTIVAGPAWSSGTSRGVGAGTTQIQMLNGIWVNTVSMTAHNGANTFTVPALQGTYLGTIYCNANAAVTMNFLPASVAGGSNNIMGLFNAYNQKRVSSIERDSTSAYTYTSNVVRIADNSNSNRVTFVDGLQQSPISVAYQSRTGLVVNGASTFIGIGVDSGEYVYFLTCRFHRSYYGKPVAVDIEYQLVIKPTLGLAFYPSLRSRRWGEREPVQCCWAKRDASFVGYVACGTAETFELLNQGATHTRSDSRPRCDDRSVLR